MWVTNTTHSDDSDTFSRYSDESFLFYLKSQIKSTVHNVWKALLASGKWLSTKGDDVAKRVSVKQLTAIFEHVGLESDHTPTPEIKPTLWQKFHSLPPPLNRLEQFNRKYTGKLGLGMQAYGYLRGFRDLLRENDEDFERHLAMASFSSNIGIEVAQEALNQYGSHLFNRASDRVLN